MTDHQLNAVWTKLQQESAELAAVYAWLDANVIEDEYCESWIFDGDTHEASFSAVVKAAIREQGECS